MNNLFAVKFLSILSMLKNKDKWLGTLNIFSDYLKSPDDNLNRHVLCSPTIQHFFKSKGYDFNRYRLVIPGEILTMDLSKVKVEVYSPNGYLVDEILYKDWSFELSMAIEIELLEILLDINPY